MNKTALTNFLLRRMQGQRYLEIGFLEDDYHFNRVKCPQKKRIIVSGNRFTAVAGDTEKYDLVFIDGIHTEEQVAEDIRYALGCLNAGGMILLHDCMPPDEWHQRDHAQFREGESWNGTVWKAVLRYFNTAVHKCTLVDTDWGCGIIDTSAAQVPRCEVLPDTLHYSADYARLLAYKVPVSQFLTAYVKVFYHLACMGNWQEVFSQQMQQLQRHGFQWIDITLLGNSRDQLLVKEIVSRIRLPVHLLFVRNDFREFEKPALKAIQEYADQFDGYVLYLHSKGVSNPDDETKKKWRQLMMQELVENSDRCKKELCRYDLVGVNWRSMPPVSHFCGNFWYASTEYLRKLPDFGHYYDHPRYRIWDAVNSKRLGCEFWIGSRSEKARVLSLAYRNVDFCNADFWKDKQI